MSCLTATYPRRTPSHIRTAGTGGRCARGHLRTPEIAPQNRPNFRSNSTGKERDEETGYSYFGARYMDHELLTGWLSVDPMADKYPSLSPYNYCAWNPVKLMDPDGRDFDPTMEKYAAQVFKFCLQEIGKLSKLDHLDDNQKKRLSEYQNTMTELNAMNDDHTTLYSLKIVNITDDSSDGLTMCTGEREGRTVIQVYLNAAGDRMPETSEGHLTRRGLYSFAHELKHCYQFYNKETAYVQGSDGYRPYKSSELEIAAFERGAAFGCPRKWDTERFSPTYKNINEQGSFEHFIEENSGKRIIKHK